MILPRSKGVLLVLLWSITIFIFEFFTVFDYDIIPHIHNSTFYFSIIPIYFVVGLAADICVGRYKVIVASVYCVFVGWICHCISFFITHKLAQEVIKIVGFVVGCMGAAGVLTISVPFNIDQLVYVGASADELSVAIYWHVLGFPLGKGLAKLTHCLVTNKVHRQIIYLCVSGVATVATIVIETLFPVPLPDNYGFQMGIPMMQKP